MLFLKSALFLVLSTSVLAANTVCGCGAMEEIGEVESHQHHDHGSHNNDLTLSCTNLDCDGCDVGIAFNERDQLKKQGFDKDLGYAISNAFLFNERGGANRSEKRYRDPPIIHGTPALRYDVIIQ